MSGDCGHGWGYHFEGRSGPCYRCKAMDEIKREEDIADLERQLAEAKTEIEAMRPVVEAAIEDGKEKTMKSLTRLRATSSEYESRNKP